MALTKVLTGGLAADSVDNTILKLDDDFALTGTVTGAGGMDLLLSDTISSAVAQYDISSTYINGTYDEYILDYNLAPATDNVDLDSRVFIGGAIQTGSIYGYENSLNSASSYDSSNGSTVARLTIANIGNDAGEYVSGTLNLRNVNSTTFTFNYFGSNNLYNNSGNHQSTKNHGMLVVANRASIVNGFRLFFGSANIASGTVKLYGIRT